MTSFYDFEFSFLTCGLYFGIIKIQTSSFSMRMTKPVKLQNYINEIYDN